MKLTVGTIEHITQLAAFRQEGRLSESDHVELFDAIDCLDSDELSELFGIAQVGNYQAVEQYSATVADAKRRGTGTAEYLFGLRELGTHLAAGALKLKLVRTP